MSSQCFTSIDVSAKSIPCTFQSLNDVPRRGTVVAKNIQLCSGVCYMGLLGPRVPRSGFPIGTARAASLPGKCLVQVLVLSCLSRAEGVGVHPSRGGVDKAGHRQSLGYLSVVGDVQARGV